MTGTRADRLRQMHARKAEVGPMHAGVTRHVRAATSDTPGEETPTASTAELWLYGVVGGWWFGFDAHTVADALRGLDVDHIQVRLHSPGGDVMDGIAIRNLLANHKASVTVVVDGLAASSASIIALGGDEIVMSPGSQLMLHDPWMFTIGNALELRQDADLLDKQADNLAAIYARRGGGTAAQWREVMTAAPDGTWYSDEEAVTAGLADSVGTRTSSTPPPAEPDPTGEDFDDDMAARAAWDSESLHPAARAAWRGHQPPPASAAGTTEKKGAALVDLTPEQINSLRQQVGFPENADATTIVSATLEALAENAADTPATAQVPDGMVVIEAAVLDDLRSGAADGRAARQRLDDAARDTAIDAAIRAGKTTPARREHWAAAWAADAEGARTMLDALEPGLAVPTAELGHGGEPDTTEADSLYAAVFGDDQKIGV